MTSADDCQRLATAAIDSLPEGAELDGVSVALIELGVAVSVTCLDRDAIDRTIARALDVGASVAQVQETIALISGLGVHSLMASATRVLEMAGRRGLTDPNVPLDAERQALWARYVGDDPFWTQFETEVPGFLDAMLRLSPDIFRGFFEFCAIPWKSGTVRALTKELIAMASDATPTHRFMPGFKVHLHNAIKLGAGQRAVLQTLEIAASAPAHDGFA
jgi:alkylhydroperoxidase/carboxymuconolactone decarboxylase family protein YurZ